MLLMRKQCYSMVKRFRYSILDCPSVPLRKSVKSILRQHCSSWDPSTHIKLATWLEVTCLKISIMRTFMCCGICYMFSAYFCTSCSVSVLMPLSPVLTISHLHNMAPLHRKKVRCKRQDYSQSEKPKGGVAHTILYLNINPIQHCLPPDHSPRC